MTISGLKFPMQVTAAGRLAIVDEDAKIRQNIERIANTVLRERFMEPNNGTGLSRLLFRNISSTTIPTITHQVQEAIAEQEPRVVLTRVTVVETTTTLQGSNALVLEIQYARRDTREISMFEMTVG